MRHPLDVFTTKPLPLQGGAALALALLGNPRTITFLFYLKPHRLHNTPIPERVWVKQTPKIYVCVVGNPHPLLTLNPIPPILNTHFLAPFPIMPRPPFEKQMGNWPVLPWQAFLPFPKKKQGGNRFREMRLGMSKRKNEVVFTLIQERQSQNPQPLSHHSHLWLERHLVCHRCVTFHMRSE